MDLLDYAKEELKRIEDKCEDDESLEVQKEMSKEVLDVLGVLCNQGHSGCTANYIINLIKKLWLYKPLTPLTGEDDEWEETRKGHYQNKRCSAVFKENGKAYYMDGYAYCEPKSDAWFVTRESRKYISFPCDPSELETEYRKLFFSSKYIPIRIANKFHLYRKVR